MARWLSRLLILAGLVMVGVYGWSEIERRLFQFLEGRAFEQARQERGTRERPDIIVEFPPPGPPQPARTQPPPAPPLKRAEPLPDPGSVIGQIEIPRVGVKAMMVAGIDDKSLRRAVGVIDGTPMPGQPGNSGIAGHRDTFFSGLRDIRKDDRIVVTTLNGTYEYEVEFMAVVGPRNVDVLKPTVRPSLTLVTCYPFNYVGNAPRRYIVRAGQVSPQEPGP